MKLEIEKFLEHIDEWKFKVHEELKGLSPAQRKAYWKQVRDDARKMGLNAVEPEEPRNGQPNGFDALASVVIQRQPLHPRVEVPMPAPALYLETSVWGSLAPRQPRDRRQIVHRLLRLLDGVRGHCVISEVVVGEIEEASSNKSEQILEYLDRAQPTIRPITEAIASLALAYIAAGVLPEGREADALHVAAATCLQLDFLVSWNHRHMTRPKKRLEYEAVNRLHGYLKTPMICNPFEACNEIRDREIPGPH